MNEQIDRSRDGEVALEDAARLARIPAARVRRYVRVGLVRPVRVERRVAFFGEAELAQLRRIRRLNEDLGINTAGVEVVLRLLGEIEALQAELARRRRG
jgi:MerR family transcriptional regulator/heat shock protein HspR